MTSEGERQRKAADDRPGDQRDYSLHCRAPSRRLLLMVTRLSAKRVPMRLRPAVARKSLTMHVLSRRRGMCRVWTRESPPIWRRNPADGQLFGRGVA